MIAKAILMSNVDEVDEYNSIVEECGGVEEAFNLGKIDNAVIPKFMDSEFLFKMSDVKSAWIIYDPDKLINVKIGDGDLWTLKWDELLWLKLKTYFNERD